MQLEDLYADFIAVLRGSVHGPRVLDTPLLPSNSSAVQVADVLSSPEETSVSEKLAEKAYELRPRDEGASGAADVEGPALLFHDLKLAFGRTLAGYPQTAPEYDELTQLFKFAVDLLLREANRLGFVRLRSDAPTDPAEADEYLFRISQGFQTISAEIQDFNGETFWVTAANGPLFMSSTNKAPIDPRDTGVAGSVHTVKLLPHIARAPESTLGFVSPLNPRFPQPNAPPTDLLSRFVHPNAHATLPPQWITGQDAYSSFAPTSDSAGAVVGAEDVASVWVENAAAEDLRKAGLMPAPPSSTDTPAPSADAKQLNGITTMQTNGTIPPLGAAVPVDHSAGVTSADHPVPGSPGIPVSSGAGPPPTQFGTASSVAFPPPGVDVPVPASVINQMQRPGQPGAPAETGYAIPGSDSTYNSPASLSMSQSPKPEITETVAAEPLSGSDLEALLRWTPYNFVDADEIEAAETGKERELVSRLLLELQYMQRERLAAPGAELEVGENERHVALKAANVLARLVDGASKDAISLKVDTRLPVLMRNYAGSLPAATDPAMLQAPQFAQQPPQRLQSLGLRGQPNPQLSRPSRRR